jgi:hypothetical protein
VGKLKVNVTISTYAFISVEPDPVGVGQTAYVNFWIDKVPPTAEGSWGSRWHDMNIGGVWVLADGKGTSEKATASIMDRAIAIAILFLFTFHSP